jgi:hypothetical protein
MSFKITHNADKIAIQVDRSLKAKQKGINKAVVNYINKVEKDAKTNLTTGSTNNSEPSVYTGKLLGSFRKKNKLSKNGGSITLYVNAPYAPFVEFGTGNGAKNIPSELSSYASRFRGAKGEGGSRIDNLTKYLKSKNYDDKRIYFTIKKIMEEGTKAHPFFFPAVFSNTLTLRNGLRKALKKKR